MKNRTFKKSGVPRTPGKTWKPSKTRIWKIRRYLEIREKHAIRTKWDIQRIGDTDPGLPEKHENLELYQRDPNLDFKYDFKLFLYYFISFDQIFWKKWKICLVIFDRFLIIFYIFDPRILKFVYSEKSYKNNIKSYETL